MRGNALLVLLGLTFGCTKAGTPTDGHMSRGDQARMVESEALHKRGEAEYHRLSDELQVFASKNAWTAVERVFRKINKTGHPLGKPLSPYLQAPPPPPPGRSLGQTSQIAGSN